MLAARFAETPDQHLDVGVQKHDAAAHAILTQRRDDFRQRAQIGRAAREDIEKLLGIKVYLELFVRVQKNWTRDTRALRKFGY